MKYVIPDVKAPIINATLLINDRNSEVTDNCSFILFVTLLIPIIVHILSY